MNIKELKALIESSTNYRFDVDENVLLLRGLAKNTSIAIEIVAEDGRVSFHGRDARKGVCGFVATRRTKDAIRTLEVFAKRYGHAEPNQTTLF